MGSKGPYHWRFLRAILQAHLGELAHAAAGLALLLLAHSAVIKAPLL